MAGPEGAHLHVQSALGGGESAYGAAGGGRESACVAAVREFESAHEAAESVSESAQSANGHGAANSDSESAQEASGLGAAVARGYGIDSVSDTGASQAQAGPGEGTDPPGAYVRLHLPAKVHFPSARNIAVSIFIDTGSDVCLVKRGLTPIADLRPALQPMRLMGANRGAIAGGQLQVLANLRFEGDNPLTGKRFGVTAPTTLLEADIEEDIILSLEWLGERHFDVHAREHGLMAHIDDKQLWLPGNEGDLRMKDVMSRGQVKAVPAVPVRRALDLFCGRKSAARALQKLGFRVITLDSDPARDPDICCDIMQWDYKAMYPPEYFDLVVACPPCTEYSLALTSRARDLDKADAIVRKTLEAIAYLAPQRWWLETPRTGLLARRDFMQSHPYLDCDHCQFEVLGYQKPTRFFGSKHLLDLAPVKCDGRSCPSLVEVDQDTHKRRAHKMPMGGHQGCVKREVAYHIPEKLVLYACGLAPYEGPPAAPSGVVRHPPFPSAVQ